MLHLMLREGDYFVVGDNVKICYDRSKGRNQIFVGIDAPKNISVL